MKGEIWMHSRTSRWRLAFAALAVIAALVAAPQAWAQNPTGTLTGTVTDNTGAGLPGVTVTATSANLQGDRTAQTSSNGGYKLAFLPPGVYQVTYELEGFKTAVKEIKISAAQASVADVAMELGVVSEEIVVVGQQGSISETGTGAATITENEIDKLASNRDVISAVNLAPGVSDTGFGQSNSPSISGAATFENLFMINGVSVNENIRGGALNLFIEDAIQETTTTTSGVSAEYGRFTGGVINAITKSGGNTWEGSFRTNFTNQDWEARTPKTITVTTRSTRSTRGPSAASCGRTTCGSSAPAATARPLLLGRPASPTFPSRRAPPRTASRPSSPPPRTRATASSAPTSTSSRPPRALSSAPSSTCAASTPAARTRRPSSR